MNIEQSLSLGQQLNAKKQQLVSQLLPVIKAFEKETGINISCIDVERRRSIGYPDVIDLRIGLVLED